MNYMGLEINNTYTFCDLKGYAVTEHCNLTAENPEGKKQSFLIVRTDNESKGLKRYIVINENSRIRISEQIGKNSICAIRYDGAMLVFSNNGMCNLDGWSLIGI